MSEEGVEVAFQGEMNNLGEVSVVHVGKDAQKLCVEVSGGLRESGCEFAT